ncbi:Hint domain-containing protein [Acidocella aromatica]|uniref:Hedgehog/Intein (Hint) domain-containing protein n=1 Tax=Acidocella aromatica TaxID=1303579 RepID=A0A840VNS9_9PROT|nr:Hint domain-containing protein [Acidocella aromatica]MBB5371982.1 hypothetical protein [Acidocella aromatica]
MSDTWKGSSTSWFTKNNWSGGVPTNSANGTQSVVISGTTTNQPVISPTASGAADIYVAQTLTVDSTTYTVLLETQIAGQLITLSNGANLTIQGIAMGVFYGNTGTTPTGATMTGLHGALSATPSYDSHLQLIARGTDTLTVDTVNENFGLITIGSGDKLTISNITTGGNQQAPHGLINYGLITIASGGELDITSTNGSSGTVANFYNAGWIVDNGGTLNIASSVLDGANTASSATSIDGYIVLEGGANAILASTITSREEVLFADTSSNTLQIAAGTLFAGTVAGFGATDTIIVNGFTGTSNATLVSSGTTTKLVTSNGTVQTTITLAGTLSGGLAVGTNSSTGQEFILLGGSTLTSSTIASGTTFGNGTVSLGGTSVPAITLSGTAGISGSGTDVKVNSSLTGNGTLFIDNSATLALGNTAGTDAGITVLFGTHGSATAPNTLILNDNPSGFGGKINNFGVNDEIIVGSNVLAQPTAGQGLVLSYSSATGVLTVTDTLSSTGSAVSSTQLTIAGTAAGALSTASFVALEGSSGIDIELAPTTATNFTFSTSGIGSFEQASNFTGGTAPGDIITSLETVSITAGTASISSGGVSENGIITVASGAAFYDAGSLSGTGTLAVGAGGSATLSGTTTLGSIFDAGTLVLGGNDAAAITIASGAQATISSGFSDTVAITGAGTLTVNSGVTATLAAGSSVATVIDAGTIDLAGVTGGVIFLNGNNADSVVDFSGTDVTGHVLNTTLSDFGTHDTIILGSSNFSLSGTTDQLTDSYNNGTLVVTDETNGETVTIDVSLAAGVSPNSIAMEDSTGQLVIHLCFYPGTRIATPEGEMAVEALQAGDLVVTANGTKPVRWVGQSHVHTRFADPLRSLPIRIKAGALGDSLPVRDLLLSPDHAVFIDGILVQASALVNGTSIVREYDAPEQFTYYHVELETHELLLAEGALAESFVDNVDRMHFHNWDERKAPAEAIVEMDYPRAKSARQVPMAIRQRLGGNAVNAA